MILPGTGPILMRWLSSALSTMVVSIVLWGEQPSRSHVDTYSTSITFLFGNFKDRAATATLVNDLAIETSRGCKLHAI